MRQAPVSPMIGRSEAMGILRERVALLASQESWVAFVGEAGSGRRLAAATLHALSGRRGEPFVELECAAPGIERVAGFRERLANLLEESLEGVLFLRNVDRLSVPAQADLAAVLPESSSARVLCSSAHELGALAAEARFDPALARLLAAEVVSVPPLRVRGGDVLPISRHFIDAIGKANELAPIHLSPAALALMERYRWPGNVGELRDAVERAVTLATQGVLQPEHLPEAVRKGGALADVGPGRSPRRFREAKRRVVDSFERSYLAEILAWHRGNVTAAAAQAGMLRSALQRLLRKHDLHSSDYRKMERALPPRRDQV